MVLPLDKQSKEYISINTHKGLYCYNQLPFGVALTPSISQRTMENLLQGINHACGYLDEILVIGTTEQEHLQNLDAVLSRLETTGMRLKYPFCCLQFNIWVTKFQLAEFKVQGIKTLLHQWMYLSSTITVSFYQTCLTPWLPYTESFRKMQSIFGQKAFQTAKESLTSDSVLVHFDPKIK